MTGANMKQVEFHAGPTALSQDEAFVLLARLRREYQLYSAATAARDGYRTAALAVCSMIECTANPDDLWTSLPSNEDGLRGSVRLGDHLALTRHTLGLIV
jgi:hypothetical protein